jgi:hypothetical protein
MQKNKIYDSQENGTKQNEFNNQNRELKNINNSDEGGENNC